MTKDAELQILTEAIKKLGPQSYCGPWLESVLKDVERDIRDDVPVSATLQSTRVQCEELLKVTRAEAKEIRWQADIDAATRENKARDKASQSYETAHSALTAALRALDGGSC